jgi:hypothetical protein
MLFLVIKVYVAACVLQGYVLLIIKNGILGTAHNANLPIAQTSSPANLVLLMLYLGNVNL